MGFVSDVTRVGNNGKKKGVRGKDRITNTPHRHFQHRLIKCSLVAGWVKERKGKERRGKERTRWVNLTMVVI